MRTTWGSEEENVLPVALAAIPWMKRLSAMKTKRWFPKWRWNDVAALVVGLLFLVFFFALSFKIDDWLMRHFAWDY
jgi:hypothetical protein